MSSFFEINKAQIAVLLTWNKTSIEFEYFYKPYYIGGFSCTIKTKKSLLNK